MKIRILLAGSVLASPGSKVWMVSTLGILLSFPCVAAAADRFGSFAVCPEQRICAFSKDYSTAEGAEAAALRECRDKGGRACKIKKTFKNTCAALALANDTQGWGYATRSTLAEAEQAAVRECKPHGQDCVVRCSVCAKATRTTSPTPAPPPAPPEVIVVPQPTPPGIIDVRPGPRSCYCCWKEMRGGQRRDPRTGRIIMVDRVVNRCAWMSRARCRTMGLDGGRCR